MDVFFAHTTTADWYNVGQVSIEILPDEILLNILDFYIEAQRRSDQGIQACHTLVYARRRWRNIVLGSPRRLNL